MGKYKKATSILIILCLSITFFAIFPSNAYAAPPPWDVSVWPDKIYIEPPYCRDSFIVTVTSAYDDKPIMLLFDELSEGDWSFDMNMGKLISSTPIEVKEGNYPGGANYQVIVTFNVVSPWVKPAGEYRVRVWAFPEGVDPFEYKVYDIVTLVIVDSGVEECYPDYKPPPPSEDDTGITTDTNGDTQDTKSDTTDDTRDTSTDITDDWPPSTTDTTTDDTIDTIDGWRWWRWWKIDWNWWNRWWLGWWPLSNQKAFDFSLEVFPALHSVESGQSVSFTADVKHISGATQLVALNVSGLPAGAYSSFSIPLAYPTFTSALNLSIDSSLKPGTYPITVTGNGGGKTHSATVNLTVAENRKQTSLSVSVTPTNVKTDETASVGGALSPAISVPIELIYTRPDGFDMIKNITTSSGAFSDLFVPDMPGTWSVRARWPGDDSHFGCESQPVSLSVEALPQTVPVWQKILGVASLIIIIIIIILIIYLILRCRRRIKDKKIVQTATQIKQCINCGAPIPGELDYCPNCGKKI